MAKDVYYFSHDANARHDPKILAMRSVYGAEGYGWFWILVEMMREADGYKLDMQGKYIYHAYAKQMECKCMEDAQRFILDCINEFELFGSDGAFFWSNSLLNRMNKKEKVKEARQAAANKRWGKSEENQGVSDSDDAKDMQSECKTDAIASKNDALKERKGKESKLNKKDIKDKPFSFSVYTSNPDLQEALNSFVDFRKSIKKPMNEKAVSLLLKNLDKLGNDDTEKIAVLEQSIVNGWQGVFELKDNGSVRQIHRPGSNRQKSSFERLQEMIQEEKNGQAPNNDVDWDLFR